MLQHASPRLAPLEASGSRDRWREINDGPGFAFDALTNDELAIVREMILRQYLDRLGAVSSALRSEAAAAGIARYHTLALPFEHAAFWSKEKRVLPAATHAALARLGFFRRIREMMPSARIYGDDLMWRIVRPDAAGDIGPVHADKWFWDAGHGSIPANTARFKMWTAVYTEPGRNGLCVKEHSHSSDDWNHRFELKNGQLKPVIDETPEELGMKLLLLKPGEMVLFHDALLHGGVVNRGTTCRVSIEMTILYAIEEGERALAPFRRQAA